MSRALTWLNALMHRRRGGSTTWWRHWSTRNTLKYMKRHGVMSRTDLLAAGVSSNEIQRLVRGRRWTRLRTGIYATTPKTIREPWLLTFAGELCWGGEHAAMSHRAAAFLYGLDGFLSPTVPDIVVPASSACRGSHVHRTQFDLPTVTLFDLPVVTPEVCITQLGHVVSENAVEAALESALRHGLTTVERMRAVAHGPLGRIDGGKVLRSIVRRRPPDLAPTATHLETAVVQILRSFGCRSVERHARVDGITLSLVARKRHVAVSCCPGSRPVLRDRDRALLLDAGWTIVEVTQAEFAADEHAVTEAVRTAIVTAARQSARERRVSRRAELPPRGRSSRPEVHALKSSTAA